MFAYADCGAYGFLCLFFYFSSASENSETGSRTERMETVASGHLAKAPRATAGNDSEAESR